MELVQIYFTNLNKISIITGTVPVPISLHFFLLFFNLFLLDPNPHIEC